MGDRINPDRAKHLRASSAETSILGILLLYPELLSEVTAGDIRLNENDFITTFNRRVFSFLVTCWEQHGNFDMGYLGEYFSEDEIGRIVGMQVARGQLTQNDISVLCDNITVLREEVERERQKNEETSADGIMDFIIKRRNEENTKKK